MEIYRKREGREAERQTRILKVYVNFPQKLIQT